VDDRLVSGVEPSREELLVLVAAQARVIEEQAQRIEQLEALVVELQRRLGQNSRNSSKPPSSDGPAKPARRSQRGSGRSPGKQPGAPGASLSRSADPDVVIDHVPAACRGCGSGLATATEAGVVVRQVIDIPEVTVSTTEHRMHKRRCACGVVTAGAAPPEAIAPVVYGPNLRALAVYLLVFQHVPVERTALLLADVCGAAVSTGWVCRTLARTSDALADVDKLIKTLLVAAHVLHVDETSTQIAGRRYWLHVACTSLLTAFHLHPSRGRVAVDEFGVLPAFAGVCVHDALSVYDAHAYPGAVHALCGAHLIRELTAADEANPGQKWPTQARDALLALNTAAHRARTAGLTQIPPEIAGFYLTLFTQAVAVGFSLHPRAPGREQTKTRNLLERLRERGGEVLRFAHDLRVPFTNNQAERDLRPAKTQLKISGCHHSTAGATAWLRVRGYISTARKHGINVMTAIRDAITGDPWTPPVALPT
jgi:transposase